MGLEQRYFFVYIRPIYLIVPDARDIRRGRAFYLPSPAFGASEGHLPGGCWIGWLFALIRKSSYKAFGKLMGVDMATDSRYNQGWL